MRTIGFVLMCGLVGLVACGTRSEKSEGARVVDLTSALEGDTVLPLSLVASDIEYIPLETHPNCILGNYWNISVSVFDEFMLLCDMNSQQGSLPYHLFDRQGKYIGQLGGIGQGPSEYQRIAGIACDEKERKIFLLNQYPSKILVYDFNRNFIENLPVGSKAAKMILGKNGTLGIMHLPYSEDVQDSARFEWIDYKGKVLNSYPLYKSRPRDGGGMYARSARLYSLKDDIYFFEHPFDTVYRLDPASGFSAAMSLELGPTRMPREMMLDQRKFSEGFHAYTFLNRFFETEEFIYVNLISKQLTVTILHEKATGACWALKPNDQFEGFFLATQGLINDLDGGVPFWPKSRYNNYLVSITAPEVLIPAFKDRPDPNITLKYPELRNKLLDLSGSLKDEDNPVVVMVKLK